MTRELVYSPQARADLEEIFWFIAEDNPRRAATKYLTRLFRVGDLSKI